MPELDYEALAHQYGGMTLEDLARQYGAIGVEDPTSFGTKVWRTLTGEVSQGVGNIVGGAKQVLGLEEGQPGTSGLRSILGLAQLTSAPITALARPTAEALVGPESRWKTPVEIGLSLPLGLLGGRALGAVKAGAGRLLGGASPGVTTGMEATAAKAAAPSALTVSEQLVPAELPAGEAIRRTLAVPEVREIADMIINAKGRIPDDVRRVFLRATEAIAAGETSVDPALAALVRQGTSEAGQVLAQWSRVRRALDVLQGVPEQALGETAPTWWEALGGGLRRLENVRRGLLVTQLATTMRNIVSQAGRYSLNVADEALQSVLMGRPARETLGQLMDNVIAPFRVLGSAERRALVETLEEAPDQALRLMSRHSMIEAGLETKTVRWLNTLNRAQERMFQSFAFDAKLRDEMRKRGLDLLLTPADQIPHEAIQRATQHALELTFAQGAQGPIAKGMLEVFQKVPFLTTINPFPRFNYANALRFLYEFSPAGTARLFSKEVVEQMASGNPELAAKAISRASLGTLMLTTALAYRQSPDAGERPDEVRVGTQTVSLQAYAPFSTYLYLAEGMLDATRAPADRKMSLADYSKLVVGLNRIAGTGLIFVDLLRDRSPEDVAQEFSNLAREFAGQYAGGFAVPLRTAKDLLASVSPEESIRRETRTEPLTGPIRANIPGLSQTLPPAASPIRPGLLMEEHPLLRQATGLSLKEKTEVEHLVDRLLQPSRLSPRTGVPQADLEIKREMGAPVYLLMDAIRQAPKFQSLPLSSQRLVLEEVLKRERQAAQKRIDPELQAKISVRRLDPDVVDLLQRLGITIPADWLQKY